MHLFISKHSIYITVSGGAQCARRLTGFIIKFILDLLISKRSAALIETLNWDNTYSSN